MSIHSLLKVDTFFTNLYLKNSHQSKSRSSHLEVLCEKDLLKNIAKVTGKQLRWSLSLYLNNYPEKHLRKTTSANDC